MDFTTRFNIWHKVYYLELEHKREESKCSICKGVGLVDISGTEKKALCPECSGRGVLIGEPFKRWKVGGVSIIGKLSYEQKYSENAKIMYMLEETGVGSGILHYQCNLFSTMEEAERQCQYRNKNKLFKMENDYLQCGGK